MIAIRIGILTTELTAEEERLIEAGKQRGHEVVPLEVLKFSMSICTDNPRIFYEGVRISDEYDAIIPRIDPPHTDFGYMVLRQFQAMGVYVTDTAYSLELCRDKLRCLQYLMRSEVPFPTTGFVHTKSDYKKIINAVGGCPLVIKLNEGTEGVGVFLAEDEKAAQNFLGTFKQFDVPVMTQEFVKESAGTDIRVVVVGDEVIGALQRESQDGDFRANISLGATTVPVELTQAEKDLVLKSMQALKLNMAGVDLMRTKNGPLILEINSAQDFAKEYDAEAILGIDLAGMMIDYAEAGKKAYDQGEGVWLEPDPAPLLATRKVV